MIEVYVWLPFGYAPSADEVFREMFEKREKVNKVNESITNRFFTNPFLDLDLSNYDNRTFLEKVTQMNNPIPIVREAMMQEIQRACGHASLCLTLKNGRKEYLSFWPTKDNIKKVVFRTEGKFLNSFEEDKKGMGRYPDELRILSNLDEDKVYKYIRKCKKEHKEKSYEYNLFFKNCSTIIASALKEGVPRNLLTELKEFWSLRCSESIEAAGVYGLTLMALYSIATDRKMTEQDRRIIEKVRDSFIGGSSSNGAKMINKHFSSTKSVFSVFEIGLQTPKSVLEYANHLLPETES